MTFKGQEKRKSLIEFIMKSMESLVKIHEIPNNIEDHEEKEMLKS